MIGLFVALYFLYKCVFADVDLSEEQGASLVLAIMIEGCIEAMFYTAVKFWRNKQ